MRQVYLVTAACLLVAGCASTENGRVEQTSRGTHYGLDDQPGTSVTGEGTLMPGAYNPRDPAIGQFTGQERTPGLIGQRPANPREADARQFDHSAPPLIGTGAGTLGQSGMIPGNSSVSGSTLVEAPLNPGAQPSASDIYRPSASPGRSDVPAPTAVGQGPGIESASGSVTNNATIPSRVDETRPGAR